MRHVASNDNNRPGGYPLSRNITGPAWQVLNESAAIELTLKMTTISSEELRMSDEERRVSALVMLMLLAQAYYRML
ncbi:MAG: hypothetical protein PVJ57_19560 [Phycisphaerae bacterium]|jgi:hypothetical protein